MRLVNPLAIPGYLNLKLDQDFMMDSKSVGAGGTSSVYRGTLINPHLVDKYGFQSCVLKMFKGIDNFSTSDTTSNSIMNDKTPFYYEIAIMNILGMHPNIVQFLGYCEAPALIVMKMYERDLKSALRNSNFETSPLVCLKIAVDVARGMDYIHKHGVLHLDLKPRKSRNIRNVR